MVYSVLNKDKSAIPLLFKGPEVLSSPSDKAKLFAKNWSKKSNLQDAGISMCVFHSRTNLRMCNIMQLSRWLKWSKQTLTHPRYLVLIVFQWSFERTEPELLYIPAELVNMCLKKSCFPIAGRSHQWSLYLRMLEKGLQLKTATLVVFSVVSKVCG